MVKVIIGYNDDILECICRLRNTLFISSTGSAWPSSHALCSRRLAAVQIMFDGLLDVLQRTAIIRVAWYVI